MLESYQKNMFLLLVSDKGYTI